MADLIVEGASIQEIEFYYSGKYKKSALIEDAYEAEDFFPLLGKKGKWLHFTASPIKDDDGKIIGAIETLLDITERKNLEDNLRFFLQEITKAQEEELAEAAEAEAEWEVAVLEPDPVGTASALIVEQQCPIKLVFPATT